MRFGDKKEVVDGIHRARRSADMCIKAKAYDKATEILGTLADTLGEHVKKPHAYFLECREALARCLWNKYCKHPDQDNCDDDMEDEVTVGREGDKGEVTEPVVEEEANQSQSKTSEENAVIEGETPISKVISGASNLIKAFEQSKQDKQNGVVNGNEKGSNNVMSPTLRKVSVLNRFEDANFGDKKTGAKPKITEKRRSPKSDMLERLAAFQSKHLQVISTFLQFH